jgi:hypothetical protein
MLQLLQNTIFPFPFRHSVQILSTVNDGKTLTRDHKL